MATNSPSCTVKSKFSSATTRLPCRLNTLARERTCNRAEDARVTSGAGLDADVANRAVLVLLIVLDPEFAKRRTAEQRGRIKQRRGQALVVAPAGGCAQRDLILLETIWPEIVAHEGTRLLHVIRHPGQGRHGSSAGAVDLGKTDGPRPGEGLQQRRRQPGMRGDER